MYKPSTYLVMTYFLTYLYIYIYIYIWDLFPTEFVTKVKPNINSVEIHPQLHNKRAFNGWCAGSSLWPLGSKLDRKLKMLDEGFCFCFRCFLFFFFLSFLNFKNFNHNCRTDLTSLEHSKVNKSWVAMGSPPSQLWHPQVKLIFVAIWS
jgi:hypothetical protein